jgi:thiol-disulfide isomerase/thioredoxin
MNLKKIIIYILLSAFIGCNRTGDKLTEINTTLINGKSFTQSDYKNKILVINVWATWCGPCIAEISELNLLAEKYSGQQGVIFLAVSDEPNETIERFLSYRNFDYQHIANGKEITKNLHTGIVSSIPKHFIVNKKGEITFQFNGTQPDIAKLLEEEIEKQK